MLKQRNVNYPVGAVSPWFRSRLAEPHKEGRRVIRTTTAVPSRPGVPIIHDSSSYVIETAILFHNTHQLTTKSPGT